MRFYEVALSGLNLKPLTYSSSAQIQPFQKVAVKLKNAIKFGFVSREVSEPEFTCAQIEQVCDESLSDFQVNLAKFISYYYTCPLGVALGLFTPCQSQPNPTPLEFSLSPDLNDKQKSALEFSLKRDVSLIFGDTGSGKSEIYIENIRRVLNQNKQALLLMPEISLTPQMQKRLSAYFGDNMGIWHSKISPKKKLELLSALQNGQIRLIAGARSALFLPFCDLGVIIVDEEHDDGYKNAATPCYNARDLSVFIGKKLGIQVILGSATPSVTSLHKFEHFRLKGTFFASQKEFIIDESQTGLSQTIKNELKSTLERGKQAVIFLPTRANFKFLLCKNCGEIVKCPFCSVSMSLHKNTNTLKCHYCGFATPNDQICQNCGDQTLEARKIGTSELKIMLESEFDGLRVAKFDKDEITTKSKLEALLRDFNDKKIDVLVGTQMLSKGHDYHDVELAVVMGLDEHLAHCNFRAREKALALCVQVAGRAGRAGRGKVVVQTMQGDFFGSYLQNYDEFAQDELSARNPLYPPFARLLRILIQNSDDEKAKNVQDKILKGLQNIENIDIIGHGKALIEIISGKFRWQILLRAHSHEPLIKAANLAAALGATPDIDPVNFS